MLKLTAIVCLFLGVTLTFAYSPYENNIIEYDVPFPVRRSLYPDHQDQIFLENGGKRVVTPYFKELVPAVAPTATSATDIAITKVGIMSKVVSFGLSLAKTFFGFFVTNGFALIIGSLGAIGLCKLTPICDKVISISSILDLKRDWSLYATPERIATATEFVKRAIRNINTLQK